MTAPSPAPIPPIAPVAPLTANQRLRVVALGWVRRAWPVAPTTPAETAALLTVAHAYADWLITGQPPDDRWLDVTLSPADDSFTIRVPAIRAVA